VPEIVGNHRGSIQAEANFPANSVSMGLAGGVGFISGAPV
jgi:hypothetical protein